MTVPAWLLQLVGVVGIVFGQYVVIREDLASLRVIAQTAANSAGEAHRRIDAVLQHKGG